MKVIIVIELDVPTPDDLPLVLEHLKPPSIPYFAGQLRVAIDPVAKHVVDYLEGDRDDLPRDKTTVATAQTSQPHTEIRGEAGPELVNLESRGTPLATPTPRLARHAGCLCPIPHAGERQEL